MFVLGLFNAVDDLLVFTFFLVRSDVETCDSGPVLLYLNLRKLKKFFGW